MAERGEGRQLARELAGRLRGRVRVVRRAPRDFGGLVSRRPLVVVWPEGEEDLLQTLAVARARRLPVSVQGAGHTVNGQSLNDGGLLLLNAPSRRDRVRRLDVGHFEVPARMRWRTVERQLNRQGRAVPVLADYLGLSVGGTLSVGGYGVDSLVHGAQVDQVERLRLITADGHARWCSAAEHGELFRHSLAGLGQLGVIDRVVVRSCRHAPVATMFTYEYEGLEELVRSFRWLAEEPPARGLFFKAVHSRGRYVATYGVPAGSLRAGLAAAPPAALGDRRHRHRLVCPRYRTVRSLAVAAWVARYRRCWRPWSDYLLDFDGLLGFTRFLTDRLRAGAFGGCLEAVYFLAVRRPAAAAQLPFEACRGSGSSVRFLVGLYNMVRRGDRAALGRVRAATRACLSAAVELGGRPYLYGWHELGEETAGTLYGDGLAELRGLRERLDPDRILGAGKLLVDGPDEVAFPPR